MDIAPEIRLVSTGGKQFKITFIVNKLVFCRPQSNETN